MSPLVKRAMRSFKSRSNVRTGLSNSSDNNAAKAMFLILHDAGETLTGSDIAAYAVTLGWEAEDASQIGKLASEIAHGKRPRVSGGPAWVPDILDIWRADLSDED